MFVFVLVRPILATIESKSILHILPFPHSPYPRKSHGARDAKGLFDCSKAICAKSADDKAISSLGSKMVKWLHLLSTWKNQVSETTNINRWVS